MSSDPGQSLRSLTYAIAYLISAVISLATNDINTKYKSHFAQLYYCIQSAQAGSPLCTWRALDTFRTEPLLLLSLFLLFLPLGAVSQIVNYNNRTLRKGCWINTNRWICPWTDDDDDATSMMIIIKTLHNGPPAKYFLIFFIHSFIHEYSVNFTIHTSGFYNNNIISNGQWDNMDTDWLTNFVPVNTSHEAWTAAQRQ